MNSSSAHPLGPRTNSLIKREIHRLPLSRAASTSGPCLGRVENCLVAFHAYEAFRATGDFSGVERPTSHNDLDVAIAMLSHGLKLSFYAYDRLKERRIHKEQELGRAAGNP